MPKIAHIIASVFLLSILFACEFYHDEESAYITILNPKDSSYSAGDSLSITWESSGITDSVTIEMRNEDTSLPQFSFPAPSNGTYKIKIEPNMISNKKWQILVSDKANRFLFGLSKMFTVKCPDFKGPVLYPDDNIYASGERIFVYWDSTYMSDSVTICLVCVDDTSLPGYSSSAVSNEIYAVDIDPKIASDKNWQIVITDKKNKAITVKSKPFLVKNDTLIPQSRKSFWYTDTCLGKCNNSDITEYIQIGQNQIYTWTKTNMYSEGRYTIDMYSPPKIEKNRLLLGHSYNSVLDQYDRGSRSVDFYLLSNDTLQKILTGDGTSSYGKERPYHFRIEYNYIPLKGQIPPANWPQKIRTDSTLKSGVQGEWALYSLTSDNSSSVWKDDSVKYSLTIKNDSGLIFCNNALILSFTYNFKNITLEFFPSFLKIDTLENIAVSTCRSDLVGTVTTSGYVSDNLDTIVFENGF